MQRLWNIKPPTPELTESICRQFGLESPIAQLLAHRGLKENGPVASFLDPKLRDLKDPFLLPDMGKAVDRILAAVERREKIVVFGDYDVDGMTSIALMLEVLGSLGAECGYFLPSRFTDGYGLKIESLRRCIDDGARLIVTVDCGTNSTEEICFAKSQGVDVIVLDHHEHNGVPFEAVAVVNPKRPESLYKEELSSVGIAFKVAHALFKQLQDKRPMLDLKDILDYVAIGTVADMVPLLGENRILVRAGLERLAVTKRPGLHILKDLASVRETISATDIAFRIAPRLNANGRLSDAQDALSLLRTKSETEAMVLAQKLHQENKRRQSIEKQATQEAIAMVAAKRDFQKDRVLVLFHPEWHIGVVGIVAAKLVKEFGKPAVVIGLESGLGKGSARTRDGFPIAEALAAAGSELIAHGGHAGAAGLTIDPARVYAFRQAINQYADKVLAGREFPSTLALDMELSKEQLRPELVEQLERLEPFGVGNPRPVFATHKVAIDSKPFLVGGAHLKFQTRIQETTFDVMGFRMAQHASAEAVMSLAWRKLDIAYNPCVNTFGGQRRYQLNLEDFRSSN